MRKSSGPLLAGLSLSIELPFLHNQVTTELRTGFMELAPAIRIGKVRGAPLSADGHCRKAN